MAAKLPGQKLPVGHFQSYDRSGNREADGRFQSTADIGRRRLERAGSPKQSLAILLGWLAPNARGTSAGQSDERALPTLKRQPLPLTFNCRATGAQFQSS